MFRNEEEEEEAHFFWRLEGQTYGQRETKNRVVKSLRQYCIAMVVQNLQNFHRQKKDLFVSCLNDDVKKQLFQYAVSDSRNPLNPETLELFLLNPQAQHKQKPCNWKVWDLSKCLQANGSFLGKITQLVADVEAVSLVSCRKLDSAAIVHFINSYSHSLTAVDLTRVFSVDDAVLEALSTIKDLRALSLRSCTRFSSTALIRLIDAATNLRSLNLSGCRTVQTPGCGEQTSIVSHIGKRLSQLCHLDLSAVNFECSNATVRELVQGKCGGILQMLCLADNVRGNTVLTERIVLTIGEMCGSMRALNLSSVQNCSIQSLIKLSNGCPLLEELVISQFSSESNDGINNQNNDGHEEEEERNINGQEELNLYDVFGKNCSNLRSLDVMAVQRDEMLRAVSYMHKLERLSIYCSNGLDGRYLGAIGHNCRNISALSLRGCSNIRDAYLADFINNFQGTNLQHLNFSCLVNVSAHTISLLNKFADTLRVLNLCHCALVTGEALLPLAASCRNLTYLNVRSCTALTNATINELRKMHSNLSVYSGMA